MLRATTAPPGSTTEDLSRPTAIWRGRVVRQVMSVMLQIGLPDGLMRRVILRVNGYSYGIMGWMGLDGWMDEIMSTML